MFFSKDVSKNISCEDKQDVSCCRALFVCRDWLSTNKSDGRISRHLPVFMSDGVDGGQMFDVVSWHQLFDEHLWLSIFKRLTYSRFTRVQRFLCAVALLFLAMVTDAMFFKGKEATYEKIRGVTIGPFQINYRSGCSTAYILSQFTLSG